MIAAVALRLNALINVDTARFVDFCVGTYRLIHYVIVYLWIVARYHPLSTCAGLSDYGLL